MIIPDSAKRILESAALAHLVTLDPDGSPQVTCAWAGVEANEIVLATLFDQRKLRNMRRDPRVTLSFETETVNEIGLTEYLVIQGRARVTEGGRPGAASRAGADLSRSRSRVSADARSPARLHHPHRCRPTRRRRALDIRQLAAPNSRKQAQRLAALLYCRTERGTNTAKMMATQMSV